MLLEPVDKELVPIAIAFSPTLVKSCRLNAFLRAVKRSWFCCSSWDLAVNCCINASYWAMYSKSDSLGLIASQFVLAWSAAAFKAAICFSFSATAFLLILRAVSRSEVSLFVVTLFFSAISVIFSFSQILYSLFISLRAVHDWSESSIFLNSFIAVFFLSNQTVLWVISYCFW